MNTARPSVYFPLKAVPTVDDKTLQSWMNRPRSDPFDEPYKGAWEHAKNGYLLATGKVSKQTQLADAFTALQSAENIRDKSPQAYQDARMRYYTLLNGENWVEEEKQRIVQSEVAPKIAAYTSSYQDMETRRNQQQRTMDVVKAVKDKVVSMKDDFKMTTNVFSKQIGELKNQIEIEKRRSLDEKKETTSWIHLVVNVLLVVFAIAAILVIIRKLATNKSTSAYTPTPRFQ